MWEWSPAGYYDDKLYVDCRDLNDWETYNNYDDTTENKNWISNPWYERESTYICYQNLVFTPNNPGLIDHYENYSGKTIFEVLPEDLS